MIQIVNKKYLIFPITSYFLKLESTSTYFLLYKGVYMKTLDFIKINPAGNTTILIENFDGSCHLSSTDVNGVEVLQLLSKSRWTFLIRQPTIARLL